MAAPAGLAWRSRGRGRGIAGGLARGGLGAQELPYVTLRTPCPFYERLVWKGNVLQLFLRSLPLLPSLPFHTLYCLTSPPFRFPLPPFTLIRPSPFTIYFLVYSPPSLLLSPLLLSPLPSPPLPFLSPTPLPSPSPPPFPFPSPPLLVRLLYSLPSPFPMPPSLCPLSLPIPLPASSQGRVIIEA